MAVSHAQTQTSDSHSHPSGFDKVNDGSDHNHPQFQDTVPIDEAVVPDSPLMEDTQVVDYSDCDEKMRTGVSGFEEEVVLDSEDEEVNGSRIVTLGNMSSDQICAAGLSYVDSQEPGEESQANALGFVDQFVSLNDDLSFGLPGIDIKKTTKVKSPPVTSIKGTQSLAKMVGLRSQNEKAKAFEWVDPEDDGASCFSDKKMESSLVNSEGKERSGIARKENVRHAYDTKCTSSGDGSKEKSIIRNLHKEITESEGKTENESLNASEDHLDGEPTELQLKPSDEGENAVGMFEVGFDTQIAAEAMEALAYGAHPGYNTLDVGSGGAAENKAHIDQSLQKSDFSNVDSISKNGNQRNRSTRTPKRAPALFQKESKRQELGPALAAVTNLKRTRFIRESCSNSAEPNNSLCTESPTSAKKRKLQSATDYSKGSSVKHQTIESISGVMRRKMEDASNNGIVTYRRKKRSLNAQSPEMISSAEVVSDGLVDKKNKLKKDEIVTYRRKKRIGGKGSHSAYISLEVKSSRKSCSLNLGLWGHPKGKRTRHNARNKICRAPAPSTPFLLLNKKDGSGSDERPESKNKMVGEEQSTYSPPVLSLKNNSDSTLLETQSGKLVGTDPTFAGKECTSPSNLKSGINMGSSKDVSHRKKPCNKNSPKSYLKKELIGLGVSGSMPDFASKDLRRRKSMAYVQVLFSQHLGDDIIKQQKKIIARLGLSVASCSMDATHFIADQFARTRNMLEFITLGKPVVTHLWLESCGEANCLISEKSYILWDAKKEKEIGFSMLVSLDCAKHCPLLKGRKVLITPNIKPGKEMITSLVKTAQGEPVEQAQIRTAKGKKKIDKLLILSCEEDEAICLPFLEKGVAVYSSELLLNGIVIQRLEYKRHQLFTDVVMKVRP